ncbi:MAG: elongation factor 4, partial [Candidatus Eisenbacteria bacterium]|nr:elongation factor 4 [Candidatus Eisenbacteria bacterium]
MVSPPPQQIRNFCIVAHIDHGKSTLADRLLELTRSVDPKRMQNQVLDNMDLERERGITIKAHAVSMVHTAGDGTSYLLNLIDTPGHVDFSYEVSRSLASAEGAILLVDVTQGIEAQTVANLYMALENDLELIPVLNKVDRADADVEAVERDLTQLLGVAPEAIFRVSAKTGQGVPELLAAIVERVPPPSGKPHAPFRGLIFDSMYDSYRGVITLVRVVDGVLVPGDRVRLPSTGKSYEVQDVGIMRLGPLPQERLTAGQVGYVIANIKNVADSRVGDTMMIDRAPLPDPVPGYKPMKPMVWCGFYPVNNDDFLPLKEALGKLRLNDSAFDFEPDSSNALGFGFRCGFLGPLHMEIVQERIHREYDCDLIATTPNVSVRVHDRKTDEWTVVSHPGRMPHPGRAYTVEEPYVQARVYTPPDMLGGVLKLLQDRRGEQQAMEFLDGNRVRLTYLLPFSEIALNFYNRLKSVSRGYATLDYEFHGYRPSDLVRLDILLNGETVDALSLIVHREKAYYVGRDLVERLKELIPRQL